MAYRIMDDTEVNESIPTSIDTWYDRYTRTWITSLLDENGYAIESAIDGRREDMNASIRHYQSAIDGNA